jgi:uncharacterized membrane protein
MTYTSAQLATDSAADAALVAKLGMLKQRLTVSNTLRTQLETKVAFARERAEALAAEAVAKYGTADVTELAAKLAAMRQDNQQAVVAFEAALTAYEAALSAVSQQVG